MGAVSALRSRKSFVGARMYGATSALLFSPGTGTSFSEADVNELNDELGMDGQDGGFDLPTSGGVESELSMGEPPVRKVQAKANAKPKAQTQSHSPATNYALDPAAAHAANAPAPHVEAASVSDLTHVDKKGKPTMVDVSKKSVTTRTAHARARLDFPSKVFDLILAELPAKVTNPSTATAQVFKPNPVPGAPGKFLGPDVSTV